MDTELKAINLSEGYRGKILLLRVTTGQGADRVILRGGQEWHQQILARVEEELAELGFTSSRPAPLGGAWASISRQAIRIWGSSEDFGVCDKSAAAKLLGDAYPGVPISVS